MNKFLIILLLGCFNVFFVEAQTLPVDFSLENIPEKPDYSKEASWSALPWIDDTADNVPTKDYTNNQADAEVDVFFVHPTTISKSYGEWNADIKDEKLNKKVDNLAVQHQASIFNGAAKVYAPRYRQANYEAFMGLGTENSTQALALAYQDVKTAFLYYLQNWNDGRPFIIAGHSQGTYHNINLMKELIDTTALLDQLVAAYLVGMPVKIDDFVSCQPCQSAYDVNCFVTWNTMKKNNYPKFYKEYYENVICHNPLSWETNPYYCSADYHKGMVPREFSRFYKNKHGAIVHEGVLWVDAVKIPGIPFTRFVKDWHIGDYNLFYGNVHENVIERVQYFLGNQ